MLYCTYPEYQAAGGTATETAFAVLCPRASRLIDGATFGRAEGHAAECEDGRTIRLWAQCQVRTACPTMGTA